MNRLVEYCGIEVGAVPVNTTGAAVTGDYVSLKDFGHLTIVIIQGAWAGGTPAVTLKQATAVAGTGEKALAFGIAKQWSKVALAANTFTAATVTSDTFNLPAVANTVTVIEVPAESLDVDNGFDCVRVDIASPGANADLVSVLYILSEARNPQATMIAATAD